MTITVLQENRKYTLEAAPGQTLLDTVRRGGFGVHAPCGGKGQCKKCTVYLVTPEGESPCLSCITPAEDGMVLRIPGGSGIRVEEAGEGTAFLVDSGRNGYGIACDIGTTTVVCRLIDLSDGRKLETLGRENAQTSYGADVISRIKASMEGQLPHMTRIIRSQLEDMILTLAREAGIDPREICAMSVAANTVMCHLLAGISPDSIGVAPYIPAATFGCTYSGTDLELPVSGDVYLAPAVSGYVGGDITADILAAGLDQSATPMLLIDVGTNGEMALGCGEEFVCCSTAAGPAFEGAQIRFGMTAAPGAIDSVVWKDGQVVCSVIGGEPARGICGSGLIDAVAMLLDVGALDETGRLLDVDEDEDIPRELLPYLCCVEGEPAFALWGDVAVTQGDIRKLQLGKGAIAAGIEVMRSLYGEDNIDGLLLAGGFGSYIRPESAARIGLIPREFLDRTRSLGNAAAQGAYMALVSQEARDRLEKIRSHMRYQELSGMQAFNNAYIEMMMFPEEG